MSTQAYASDGVREFEGGAGEKKRVGCKTSSGRNMECTLIGFNMDHPGLQASSTQRHRKQDVTNFCDLDWLVVKFNFHPYNGGQREQQYGKRKGPARLAGLNRW